MAIKSTKKIDTIGDLMREANSPPGSDARSSEDDLDPKVALEILRAIGDLSYGSVEVVVHDSKVVQIERKEKIRFASDEAARRR